MLTSLQIPLATGILKLKLRPGRVPIHRLLGFAARISSKRKFLLVSKVLGKHYPVRPLLMRWSYRALARATLKYGLTGHSLWIGMAETATGLGYGVYEAACDAGLDTGLFMQTTRYHIAGLDKLNFEEAHSHATDFFLYYPERADYRKHFLHAESLVLIDDEISTGNTFLRLIKAYQVINPALRQVFVLSLVNFAQADAIKTFEVSAGISVHWVYLRAGSLDFEDQAHPNYSDSVINVSSNSDCKKHLLAWPGRLGIQAPLSLDPNIVSDLQPWLKPVPNEDRRPILVLGSGECNAPAFLLGRALEMAGYNVRVQSTTRSPIHLGNAIQHICEFEDNYQDAIPNFLYNLNLHDYCDIVLCHETPLNTALLARLDEWQALSARFEWLDQAAPDAYAKLHFFRP